MRKGVKMWKIFFIIPNIVLNRAIENEYIAIVPHDDERVTEITEKSPSEKALVNGFEDQFKKKINPSLLIVNDDAPAFIKEVDTLVGFRNIFALTTIIKNHIDSLNGCPGTHILYSDCFDFYPIAPTKDMDGYIIHSPAVNGLIENCEERFRGQSAPGIGAPFNLRCEPDPKLFVLLENMWKRRYIKRRFEWKTRALFRSLEMAYQATTMPIENYSTIYDYGVRVSMWVSAFEILSHPRKGKANLETVIKILGDYHWYNRKVSKRQYKFKYRGQTSKINLVQKLYNELYEARNDFLHGNDVNLQSLFPFRKINQPGNKNRPHLNIFTPLLYNVALLSYLEKPREAKRYDDMPANESIKDWLNSLKKPLSESFTQSDLAEAILKAKE